MARELRNNIRSFRYSDRVAEILESVEGDSLNDKFNNLVITAYDALPEVRSELETYQYLVQTVKDSYWQLIRQSREFYWQLIRQSREFENFLRQVKAMDSQIKMLQYTLERAGCNTDEDAAQV